VRLPLPVEAFLLADPFVAAMTLPLDAHRLPRPRVVDRRGRADARVRPGVLRLDLPLRHAPPLLRVALPVPLGRHGRSPRRANKTHALRQRVKYYLLIAFSSRRRSRAARSAACSTPSASRCGPSGSGAPGAQLRHRSAGSTPCPRRATCALNGRRTRAGRPRATVWQNKQFYFHQTWLIGALLFAVLFMNRFVPRFWCRVLCPLGAFLGVIRALRPLRHGEGPLEVHRLQPLPRALPGRRQPAGRREVAQDECHMCLNCETACPEDVIKFRFSQPGLRSATNRGPTRGARPSSRPPRGLRSSRRAHRRRARHANYDDRSSSGRPGSVEEREFLERCIRCAECMKVCPNNALHPAFFEAGIEGSGRPSSSPASATASTPACSAARCAPRAPSRRSPKSRSSASARSRSRSARRSTTRGAACPGRWPPLHRVRRVLPDLAQGHLGRGGRRAEAPARLPRERPGARDGDGARAAAPRRSVALHRLRRVREGLPRAGQPAVYVTSVGETRSKTNVILLENTNYNSTPGRAR
jgi:ferredoxin